MSFKTTLAWLGVALVLVGFIYFYHRQPAQPPSQSKSAFPRITPAEVSMVQVRPGKGLEIRAVRTNGAWRIEEPIQWPAQQLSIEQFLTAFEKITPAAYITPAELAERPEAEKEYGLDNPKASILLMAGKQRVHLLAGTLTAPGDQFFAQVVGTEGVFVLPADFLKTIPAGVNDWRDRALVDLNRLQFDRVSVTNAGKVFALGRTGQDPWRLISPIRARADQARIHDALEKVHSLRAQEFVSDDPKEDLDPFGLQPAKLDLGFYLGTNVAAQLQFGRSVSNHVFARRGDWHSVVTVQGEFIADWLRPMEDFREPFLMPMPQPVQSIMVNGPQFFSVTWQTNGTWLISPSNWIGDPDLVKEFINSLAGIRIEQFTKDVVTAPDLPQFGLDTNTLHFDIQFQSPVAGSNNTVELHFGKTQEDKTFARRTDEDSVYAVSSEAVQKLPAAPWQLRLRRLWTVTPQEVKTVSVRISGQVRELVRTGDKTWALGAGSQGVVNELAVDETVRGILEASMDQWAGLGADQQAAFGIGPDSPQLVIELASGKKLALTFGRMTPSNGVYAAVLLDKQIWIGQFPWMLSRDIMAHLAPPEKKS